MYWGDGILNIVRAMKWCPLNIVEMIEFEGQGFGVLGRLCSEYSALEEVVKKGMEGRQGDVGKNSITM